MKHEFIITIDDKYCIYKYVVAKLPKESEDSYRNRLAEEQEWLECSQDDEKLLAKTKQLMFSKSTNVS